MADPIARAALAFYRATGRLLGPVMPVLLRGRTRAGKEDPARRPERLGRADLARPEGPLVWVHAASVGEVLSVLPLVRRIVEAGPRVLLTTGTVTSAKVVAGRLPPRTLHQYAPIDVTTFVGRFLDHWRPDLAVFVEQEIWPATVSEIARRGIPQVVVNARLSAKSATRWSKMAGLARALFGRLALVLAQSEADATRLRELGAGPVIVTGNLKFDVVAPDCSDYELAGLARAVGDRPVWLAASTHAGEEEMAADVHTALATRFPGLLTIVVPRHPERGAQIRAMFDQRRLPTAQRSLREPVLPETAILLADTIGELGLFYRLARIAFLGGSLAPKGGQNPIEAAALDTAVLHGPDLSNFVEIYRAFGRAHAARQIEAPAGLAEEVGRLLADPAAVDAMVRGGRRIVKHNRGALDRTVAALEPFLTPLSRTEDGGTAP